MSTDKKYKLLKDLPSCKAGEIFTKDDHVNWYNSSLGSETAFPEKFVINNPEWFEEVKEPSIVPEKFIVGKMSCSEQGSMGYGDLKWTLQFRTNKHIHYDNAVKLCNVLENVLNDTVVEDKQDITLAEAIARVYKSKEFHVIHNSVYDILVREKNAQSVQERGHEEKYYEDKVFTQAQMDTKVNSLMTTLSQCYDKSEVDAMMEDTWKVAQTLKQYPDFANFKYRSFAEYKATLPLEQKNDDKNMSTVYFDKQVLNPHAQGTQAYTNWEQGFMEAANKYFKPQPEAKDNTFVWDDQLVAEFACDLRNNREKYEKEHKSWRDSMGEFKESVKQSKQSPTNLQESKAVKPLLGVVPEFIWQEQRLNDLNAAIKRYSDAKLPVPISWITESYTIEHWIKNREEEKTEPQPSTPLQRDWEIEVYGDCGNYIKSVRRLSDNTVLVAMDGNYGSTERRDGYPNKPIKKFFIKEGLMYAQFDEGHGNNDGCLPITSIQKLPTPTEEQTVTDKTILFITEDGVEIKGGEELWAVNSDYILTHDCCHNEMFYRVSSSKYFSTEEAAEQYIIDNKPCLSRNEVMSIVRTVNDATTGKDNRSYINNGLFKLISEKLNQKQ